MKRIFLSLGVWVWVFALALVLALAVHAYATGEPNVDGDGGAVGAGGVVGDSAWDGGDDGVRITVMRGTTAIRTFDLSNVLRTRTQRWFYPRCKIDYMNGATLRQIEDRSYSNRLAPSDMPLPRIIPSSGGSTIDAIRSYFSDEYVIEHIAGIAGMTYDELISGEYKLLIEPMAYFKYNGIQYAMSATEAALFDVAVGGDLRYQMGTLTHQNQALCMYLERPDLGIGSWSGGSSGKQSNINIINYLGVGIISFRPEELEPSDPVADYIYRTDTDVITAVLVRNPLSRDMTPDTGDYAVFHINGSTYYKQVVCPAGSSQLVWVRWHTPSTAQNLTITVDSPGGGTITVNVAIEALEEQTPPNPIYDGPGVGPGITGTQYRAGFEPVTSPDWGSQTRTSWSVWVPVWNEGYWITVPDADGDAGDVDDGDAGDGDVDGGDPEDGDSGDDEPDMIWVPGWWSFSMATYEAALSVDYTLVPDDRVPTATRRGGRYTMKAGYGVNAVCEVRVIGDGGVSNYDITRVQNVLAVFPEFDYADYDRLLAPEDNGYRTTWGFKSNPYSYYGNPVHFTPVWYPDEEYTVPLAVFDVWTPGGMLYTTVTDTITISGSMYDDWYIRSYVT